MGATPTDRRDERHGAPSDAPPDARSAARESTGGVIRARVLHGMGVREFLRTPRRPRFLFELVLIGVSYWLYSLIRNAVPDHQQLAIDRGWSIMRFEHTLHIDVEHWVNHTVNRATWVIVGMNYWYATLHFVVTIGVLVWLFRWHPGRYSAVRTVLFLTTGLALLGFFFYALAPPRLLPGGDFIDTLVAHHTWGSLASGSLKTVSNQYAAMPSMHIGWSTWCAIAVVRFARPVWVRVLGAIYPLFTLAVIVSTGNHYLMDAVGGLVFLAAGFGLQWLLNGRSAYSYPQYPPDDPRAAAADATATEVDLRESAQRRPEPVGLARSAGPDPSDSAEGAP